MKMLALTRYSRLGASSRVRFFQYIPYLESMGWTVSVANLFGDRYLQEYYRTGKKSPGETWSAYLRRFRDLRGGTGHDMLWIEKELFPYLPASLEALAGISGKNCVVDYDDAVFHIYDLSLNRAVRAALGGKIDRIMRNASAVVAGNGYLADRARRAGARRVEILPSVVDIERYALRERDEGNGFIVGWIGSPSISHYLGLVEGPLAEICGDGRGRFVAVGVGAIGMRAVPVERRPWTEDTEAEEIRRFDVGIMPLSDTPWERGKCGYKLIQYMACGIPVVASPVGVNTEIVEHGRNGFLAGNEEEWTSSLRTLRDDPGLRIAMGRAGREKVEKEYSLQGNAPRMFAILKSVSAG